MTQFKNRPLPDLKIKIALLEGLASVWNEKGLTYSVTNGLQGYPETIGRDLDICFRPDELENARDLTIKYLEGEGFDVLPYKLAWVYWIVGIREHDSGVVDSVQIDLFDHLQWAFTWLIDGSEESGKRSRIGPFQVDAWTSVGKRLVLNALARNYDTFRKKPHYLELSDDEKEVLGPNLHRLSGKPADDLAAGIERKDLARIEEEIPAFRKATMAKSLTSGDKLLRRFHSAWLKQWCVNIRPVRTTPIISIVGPDLEKFRELSEGIHEYVESHLVFTCADARDLPARFEGQPDWKIWTSLIKRHFRKACRTSALQVIQIYLGYPKGDPHKALMGKSNLLVSSLPTADLIIDLAELPEQIERAAFHDHFLSMLLDWFRKYSRSVTR